jgi:hypothetical protein
METMELSILMDVFDYKITDGSEYLWKCYPDARFINFESDYAHVSVIHCTTSNVVYEVTIDATKSDIYNVTPHRWINPDFVDAHNAECIEKNIDHAIAWDDVRWTDISEVDEFLIKAGSIFNGDESDTEVEINLPDDVLLAHLLAAHKQDITFNEYVNNALRAVITGDSND